RQRRQMQPGILAGAALRRVAAVRTGRDDRVDAGPDLAVVQARVLLTGGDRGVGRGDLVGDRLATLVQGAREDDDFVYLFDAERQPTAQGVIQVGLRFQRVRHVQRGA